MDATLDTIGRRSRFRRQSTNKRITPQTRDFVWFEKLLRHGDLPTPYLLKYSDLLGMRTNKAQDRLTDLHHELNHPHQVKGKKEVPYLTDPERQYDTKETNQAQVHALGEPALRALKDANLFQDIAPIHSNNKWRHDLIIGCVTSSIELACLAEPTKYRYIFHDQIAKDFGPLSFAIEYTDIYDIRRRPKRDKKGGAKHNLIPDRFFGIEYLKEKKTLYYVLEIDRGTETQNSTDEERKSLTDNVYQYRQFIGTKEYQEKMKMRNGMMALFIVTKEGRMHATMRKVPPANYIGFQAATFFDGSLKIPKVMPEFFTAPYLRVQREPYYLNK